MKKCLITGIAGFVGNYLLKEIQSNFPEWEIYGFHRSGERSIASNYISHELDIRDSATVQAVISEIQPDFVFHLAAQAFVPKAVLDPWGTLEINVRGTLNLLDSLGRLHKSIRMIYVSSADVYGRQPAESIPLDENTLPNPTNPYGASKVAAEVYCRQYSLSHPKLEVMIARPFNHIGIGQRTEFVVPNFCLQVIHAIRESKIHTKPGKILVGDLSSTRDFLDVRDVVSAYRILATNGRSGEIYNICSGIETKIEWILSEIIRISGSKIQIEVDPSRIRVAETPRLFGKNEKLKNLNWEPRQGLLRSLEEIYSSIRDSAETQT